MDRLPFCKSLSPQLSTEQTTIAFPLRVLTRDLPYLCYGVVQTPPDYWVPAGGRLDLR